MHFLRPAAVFALLLASCAVTTGPAPDAATTVPSTSPTVPPPPSTQAPTQTLPLATLPPGAAVCDAFSNVTQVGELSDPTINEASGIAAGRRFPRLLWIHNDSRGGATIYAVNTDGDLVSTWQLDGVTALDWEDIAAGPGPEAGVTYLYVGDIGDNFSLRSEIVVYRFPEPDATRDGIVTDFETFRLTYPDPGRDAEALAVDPASGDLILVTKDRDGPEDVFRAPGIELRDGLVTRLDPVASLDLGSRVEITAADFSPNGDRIVLRSYDRVWIWPRLALDPASTFEEAPCRAASPKEVQGEAIAFDPKGVALYTVSEGTGAAINRISVDR